MAIRYVDIEPGDGKAKPARAPKPASEAAVPPAEEGAPAAPAAKTKRRKK